MSYSESFSLLTAAIIVASPVTNMRAAPGDSSALTTNLVFKAAAEIAAREAATDTKIRQLLGQIRAGEQALSRSRGDSKLLRAQLVALKKQVNDRLAAVNASFAVERTAFVDAIRGLVEAEDPSIRDALSRYAAGDLTALNQLGMLLRKTQAAGDEGIVLRRGYAALLTDAVLRGEREKSAAVAEWEAMLRADPNDATALNRLTWLYSDLGRTADAERVAARATANEQHSFLRALTLQSQGNLALRNGDFGRAARAFTQAVVLLQPIADPSSADARRVREIGKTPQERARAEYDYILWIHVPLAACLRDLSRAELKLGKLAAAQAHAADSVAHGMLVTQTMTTTKRHVEAYWSYYGTYLQQQAEVALALNDPASALEAYQRAIAANGHKGPARVPGLRVDAAKAALASKRVDEAVSLLVAAKADLATLEVSAWSVGTEGLYWEQMSALEIARGDQVKASAALTRAEAALAQAAKAEPASFYDWPTHLARVKAQARGASM
jgi:hypothetical protein